MIARLRLWMLATSTAFLLSACGAEKAQQTPTPDSPVFHAVENPEQLSAWGVFAVSDNQLKLGERVTPYNLNTALFSDYAHKLRTIWLPEGTQANYDDMETFDFPVGTVISKTFYYPLPSGASADGATVMQAPDATNALINAGFDLSSVKLIETRILVHRAEGWVALPYVWNEDQSDAVLKRTGDIAQLEIVNDAGEAKPFNYVVPNANQCAGCHATNATTRKIQPIGPKARHLNKLFSYEAKEQNQLTYWQENGILAELPEMADIPKNALWGDDSMTLDNKARSYLDINCSHCHNKNGPADTSGLLLEPHSPNGPSLGTCKLPIAAGTGTGDRKYGIVPGKPDQSIFTYRMASTNPAEMMPELGRSLSHDEGVTLIKQWIAQMDGNCG